MNDNRFVGLTLRHRERGQGLVEYALILVLVAVVVIVILALLGPAIGRTFERVACSVQYGADYIGYVTEEDETNIVVDGKTYPGGIPATNPVQVADPVCVIDMPDTAMGVTFSLVNLWDEGQPGNLV